MPEPAPAPKPAKTVRVDKWLWAVRAFKTRSEAADACRRSQVLIDGQPIKPAHKIRGAELLEVKKGPLTRTLEVVGLIEKRVGAKRVPEFSIDRTPAEELAKAEKIRKENRLNHVFDIPGQGRPTRRQREAMRRFQQAADGDADLG